MLVAEAALRAEAGPPEPQLVDASLEALKQPVESIVQSTLQERLPEV
jgi:hypothetical protein